MFIKLIKDLIYFGGIKYQINKEEFVFFEQRV